MLGLFLWISIFCLLKLLQIFSPDNSLVSSPCSALFHFLFSPPHLLGFKHLASEMFFEYADFALAVPFARNAFPQMLAICLLQVFPHMAHLLVRPILMTWNNFNTLQLLPKSSHIIHPLLFFFPHSTWEFLTDHIFFLFIFLWNLNSWEQEFLSVLFPRYPQNLE